MSVPGFAGTPSAVTSSVNDTGTFASNKLTATTPAGRLAFDGGTGPGALDLGGGLGDGRECGGKGQQRGGRGKQGATAIVHGGYSSGRGGRGGRAFGPGRWAASRAQQGSVGWAVQRPPRQGARVPPTAVIQGPAGGPRGCAAAQAAAGTGGWRPAGDPATRAAGASPACKGAGGIPAAGVPGRPGIVVIVLQVVGKTTC